MATEPSNSGTTVIFGYSFGQKVRDLHTEKVGTVVGFAHYSDGTFAYYVRSAYFGDEGGKWLNAEYLVAVED